MKMFDTQLFISEVEKRPALYNARHKEYSDRDLKYKLWDEIAVVMYQNWANLPGQECRKKVKELRVKWKSIRDHFKKEVALEKKYLTGQACIRKKRKYIYYDQLLFLLTDEEKDALSSVKIKEEIHTSPSRILEEDLELEEYDTMDYNISNSIIPKQEDSKTAIKRSQQKSTSSSAEDIALTPVQEVRYSIEDTMGNRDFLMSLLPLMNKLPDYAIVHLRLKIMELFQLFTIPHSEQYANYQVQQQQQQQSSYPTSTIAQTTPNTSNNNPSTSTPMSPVQNSGSPSGDNTDDSDMSDSSSDKS